MIRALAVETENRIASVALGGIMIIPLVEIASRKFFLTAIPGAGAYASTLTLWLGMLGAAIAAREGKLLTLATGEFLPKGRVTAVAHVFAGAVGAMIATALTLGAIVLVQTDRLAGDEITVHAEVDCRSRAAHRVRPHRAAAGVARVDAQARPCRRAAGDRRRDRPVPVPREPS